MAKEENLESPFYLETSGNWTHQLTGSETTLVHELLPVENANPVAQED